MPDSFFEIAMDLSFPLKDDNMETQKIIERITTETDLDEDEVKNQVEQKMDEFEGLVSEEGAVHLVAKENGVQISEVTEKDLKIENIVPEMRKVNLKARIANITDLNTFERDGDEEDGKVQNLVLGDDTGTIRVTLWDEQTEIAEKVEEGNPIEIHNAYTVEDNQGNAEIRLGDSTQVKNADDEEVPEIETQDSSPPSSTQKADIRQINSENAQYEVDGMVIDVYTSNPFYRVDPETGETVREDDEGNLKTDEGKEVEDPDHRLALSCVLDDGTGNIRVVLFREQARKLLDIDEETERKGDLKTVEDAAGGAIGKEVKIEGRTRFNDYFGRLELLGNSLEEIGHKEKIEELIETVGD